MSLLQSLFLGIVQGLTEFLPVSSSGHLAIIQNLFHIDTGGSILFDILLHLGTLAVIFIVYHRDIGRLITSFFDMIRDGACNLKVWRESRRGESAGTYRCIIKNNYRKFVILIVISTIPTGIIGIVGKKLITDASGTLIVPGICLLGTALLLFLSDRIEDCTKIPRDVSWKEALIVGIAQGFATLPGLSRSGATIAACLLCGFDRRFAVKYSFILSIPAILGAAVLEIAQAADPAISPGQAAIYLAGMAAAGLVGYVCIRTMLTVVKNRKFKYFAYYCGAVGIIAIVCQFIL